LKCCTSIALILLELNSRDNTALAERSLGSQASRAACSGARRDSKDSDGRDERGGQSYAGEMFRRKDFPWDVSAKRLNAPRQRDGAGRARCRREAEHAVFEQQHLRNRAGVRAELLKTRRFVHALELRHRHGADKNQGAAEQHRPPTTVWPSVTFE